MKKKTRESPSNLYGKTSQKGESSHLIRGKFWYYTVVWNQEERIIFFCTGTHVGDDENKKKKKKKKTEEKRLKRKKRKKLRRKEKRATWCGIKRIVRSGEGEYKKDAGCGARLHDVSHGDGTGR